MGSDDAGVVAVESKLVALAVETFALELVDIFVDDPEDFVDFVLLVLLLFPLLPLLVLSLLR